ncbi:MAG: RsiG family protein [Acidimicrobiia bacterium]
MASELERVLADGFPGSLEDRSLAEVRALRSECQAIETGLSYLRRMAQGRLDIVGAELGRRRQGGAPGDLAALVGQLPDILSDRTRSPGNGRLTRLLGPETVDGDLEARLAALVEGHDVESLAGLDDHDVATLRDGLEEFEREVSARRRSLFDRIDALQADITRRYRTGEASVEQLLR